MSQEDKTIAEKLLEKANCIQKEKFKNNLIERLRKAQVRKAQEDMEAAKEIGDNQLRYNSDEYKQGEFIENNPDDTIDIKRLMERERKDIKIRNPDNAVNWRDETSGIEINKYKQNLSKEMSRIQKQKLAKNR